MTRIPVCAPLLSLCLAVGCTTPVTQQDEEYSFSDDPLIETHTEASTEDSAEVTEPARIAPSDTPRIKPGLALSISVFSSGTKEVHEPMIRVSATGTIMLPLVGSVAVSGLTMEELGAELSRLYGEYLRVPTVDVQFIVDEQMGGISPWGYVTVLGRVRNPGRISIPPTQDLTLSMALQLAGGFDTSAKETDIRVTRVNAEGERLQYNINLRGIGTRGDTDKDISLKSGDVVYVPERVF